MPNGESWADKIFEWLFEHRRDRLWKEAHETPGLGLQFWAEVNLDPDMDPKLLTKEQVERLDKELSKVKTYEPLPPPQAAFKYWQAGWKPPLGEKWADYPIEELQGPLAFLAKIQGWGGLYNPLSQNIKLLPEAVSPENIAHEIAHAHYYEQLTPQMRQEVNKILDWYEKNSQEFRAVLQKWPEYWQLNPKERYAILYQYFGRDPEKIPSYLDKYYYGLKPWDITEGLGTKRWMLQQEQITPEEYYEHPWEQKTSSWADKLFKD